MSTIFNTLNIGYTGLNAAQIGIDTTGQNISNAETDGYTRKRVVQSAATPLFDAPGNIGNGVEIQNIERVFDDFTFRKYTDTYSDKEYSDYMKKTLDELSTYFPEVEDVGVKSDLKEYYNLWQQFADNPDSDSIKIALAEQTKTLSNSIKGLRSQVYDLQQKLNDELKVNIDEVNSLASQIADLNKEIDKAEAGGGYTANDLRDKRNVLERDLSRLIGAEVSVNTRNSNINIDPAKNEASGSYSLFVNGFNIVDGTSVHPLKLDNSTSQDGFYDVYYERQDGVKIPMEEEIKGGKIGAIFELRGGKIDTQSGVPTDGVLQNTIAELDSFANTLITSTNNLYAKTGTTLMTSNSLEYDGAEPLVNSDPNIQTGSFNLLIYDIDGNVVAKREINIDAVTSLTGDENSNSIQAQIEANKDDNDDGNANNDIDDMIIFSMPDTKTANQLQLSLSKEYQAQGYRFAIEDNLSTDEFSSGTNFAGALGLNKFFDGTSAKDIDLNFELKSNPSNIQAGASDIAGDNSVALNMVQNQFEKYDFTVNQQTYHDTIYSFFDTISTSVGIQANTVNSKNETITAQFNAIEQEYNSITKVSIDEELTNLIKYQTAYGAAAKVITTVDQMLNTLLGIKQ